MAAVRPNRSDEHVPVEVERKIEEETREHFDAIAPKRHTKPQRSDYATDYSDKYIPDPEDNNNTSIPEHLKFQDLEKEDPPQKLVYSGTEAIEEYVETEYYKDLNCMDKQHHTTGTGFIGMENTKGDSFKIEAGSDTNQYSSSKGNPATNDWIPSAPDAITSQSDKPNRSENL